MTRHTTTLAELDDVTSFAGYAAAVSLHAHTDWSKEGMKDVSRYFERIPVVSGFVRRELNDYARRHNEAVDFTRAWWHPPVDAKSVFESEAAQISARLGLAPIVSITDHDTIGSNLELQDLLASESVPISCEWTVPYHGGFFHLGVHNLPACLANEIFSSLSRHTRVQRPGELSRIFESLNEEPEILVVLNHPLWDLAHVGSRDHLRLVRRILAEHSGVIHALELNGYRSEQENSAVQALQEEFLLPLISGGDRHGRAPNALLNLTHASSFGGFAREIREHRHSEILVMPEYRASLVERKLATATDAMRRYPSYKGRERWTDRVWSEQQGVAHALSAEWTDGGPLWVRAAMRLFLIAASRPLRPLLRLLVWCTGASSSYDPGPASHIERRPSTASPRVHQETT